MSWKADADANPVVEDPAVTPWEQAASLGAREVERVVADGRTPTPCWPARGWPTWPPGSPWHGRGRPGSRVMLTAELGLWGYEPTPADPYIFNQRVFPATPYLSDASAVLGMVIGGPGHDDGGLPRCGRGRPRRVPQLDRAGRRAVPGRLGGRQRRGEPGHGVRGRDTGPAGTAARGRVAYVTSPGERVASVVTDKGVLRRQDGVLRVAAVPAGEGSVEDRVRAFAVVVRLRARGGARGGGAAGGAPPRRCGRCGNSTARDCSWRETRWFRGE